MAVVSCDKVRSAAESKEEKFLEHDIPGSQAIENAIKRAAQLAMIQWTPLANVPNNQGEFIAKEPVMGIPYSSVKEISTYVGLDVSFHTFMTAVHNLKSLLYSENIGKSPYHGTNCASYYGTVCSTAISYAFGLDVPYTTVALPKLPGMEKYRYDDDLSNLKLCDLFFKEGHVYMVYDIMRLDGKVKYVDIFEAAGTNVLVTHYKVNQLYDRLVKDGAEAYRYNNLREDLEYVPSKYVSLPGELEPSVEYNNEICTAKGDEASYRTDEQVTVDVLSDDYDEMILEKDGEVLSKHKVEAEKILLADLKPGLYSAYLSNEDGSRLSKSTRFQVAEIMTSCTVEADRVRIDFSTEDTKPYLCTICGRKGNYYAYYEISEEDIERGFLEIPFPDGLADPHYRITCKGEYGNFTNLLIPIKK